MSNQIFCNVRVSVVLVLSAAVLAACGNAHSVDDSNREGPIPSTEASQVAVTDAPFENFLAKLSVSERTEFATFLKRVNCVATNCSIDDLAFSDRSAVADYFYERVLGREQKGLVVRNSRVFTAPVRVCWTDDSDATTEEKAAVIANVEATWATYSNVRFDWYSSDTTPRICTEAESTEYDVKIWQDSSQTRGCTFAGKNTKSGINCKDSVGHPWANMLLEVRRGTNRDSYVAVHEMGHAIGLYHEQDRADSTCTKGVNAQESGARTVGEYDTTSIMNYCAAQSGDISSGDVGSVVFLYGGVSVNPIFSASSWLTTNVTYTATLPDGTSQSMTQSSVGSAPAAFSFGPAQSGALLDVTPSVPTLKCSVNTAAPRLRNDANRVLYFAGGTIPTVCYSTAIISTLL